jgi:hypothetical protein
MILLRRITCEEVLAAARCVWLNQETADEIAADALKILAKASIINLRFFNGKAPKCFVGGLFYLLGYRYNAQMTQKEIADMLCTTEVSIRKSYKKWLNQFPQIFADIKMKMPRQWA